MASASQPKLPDNTYIVRATTSVVDMRTYLCIAKLCTSDILEHGAVSETDHMPPVVPVCGALYKPRLSASFAHWTGNASGGHPHADVPVLGFYILTGVEALVAQL
jgi:hypothetical protein